MDAVVTGVPWEGGCTIGGYSSCTEGPKAIRSVSIRYTGYLPDFDLDAFDYLKSVISAMSHAETATIRSP